MQVSWPFFGGIPLFFARVMKVDQGPFQEDGTSEILLWKERILAIFRWNLGFLLWVPVSPSHQRSQSNQIVKGYSQELSSGLSSFYLVSSRYCGGIPPRKRMGKKWQSNLSLTPLSVCWMREKWTDCLLENEEQNPDITKQTCRSKGNPILDQTVAYCSAPSYSNQPL